MNPTVRLLPEMGLKCFSTLMEGEMKNIIAIILNKERMKDE